MTGEAIVDAALGAPPDRIRIRGRGRLALKKRFP